MHFGRRGRAAVPLDKIMFKIHVESQTSAKDMERFEFVKNHSSFFLVLMKCKARTTVEV